MAFLMARKKLNQKITDHFVIPSESISIDYKNRFRRNDKL
jgi:hypothetical protein